MKHAPPSLPLLIYDGDCNFCKRWIARWRELTDERVAYQPFQGMEHPLPDIPRSAFESAVQLIEPDGEIFSGADAVFRTLDYAQPKPKLLRLRTLPGFMPLARLAYNFIARHRSFFSRFS
jgi:predicted DCC family thiol-disulfide oxidoreductase YuxK